MLSTKEITDYVNSTSTANETKQFGFTEAKRVGDALGIPWDKFGIEQFAMGLNVELEHGRRDPETDVTHDDPMVTGKIAWTHLNEVPDYYTQLAAMKNEAKELESIPQRGGL